MTFYFQHRKVKKFKVKILYICCNPFFKGMHYLLVRFFKLLVNYNGHTNTNKNRFRLKTGEKLKGLRKKRTVNHLGIQSCTLYRCRNEGFGSMCFWHSLDASVSHSTATQIPQQTLYSFLQAFCHATNLFPSRVLGYAERKGNPCVQVTSRCYVV